ncbi:hypothetical protein NE237_032968 [Protea cynaroides]|uniref:Uncharacterized protein n=1 Tax=Protea cynaroides TaxID=273540 RepID=A0A9Q0L5S6_9MAGN|nr:hypothetical protein NE237_032968 [Protea cynaroides]
MAISDQKFLSGRGDESDSFVVDIERLYHGTDKDISANSRISQHDTFSLDLERLSHGTDKVSSPKSRITRENMMQRSFSRKGSQRGERISNTKMAASNDKAIDTAAANGDMSPKGGGGGGGDSLAEKAIKIPMGNAAVEAMNKQTQMMMMSIESRCPSNNSTTRKRQGGNRPPAWIVSPRMVVVFFATLSSIGTILLIYFTLSIRKLGEEDFSQALVQ